MVIRINHINLVKGYQNPVHTVNILGTARHGTTRHDTARHG